MQITEIRIRKVAAEGKLKAYVTVTFDGCFVIHNVKIIEGKTGHFIAMPSRKTSTGEYKDVAHPITPEFRTELQDKILAEFEAGHIEEGDIDDIQSCFLTFLKKKLKKIEKKAKNQLHKNYICV